MHRSRFHSRPWSGRPHALRASMFPTLVALCCVAGPMTTRPAWSDNYIAQTQSSFVGGMFGMRFDDVCRDVPIGIATPEERFIPQLGFATWLQTADDGSGSCQGRWVRGRFAYALTQVMQRLTAAGYGTMNVYSSIYGWRIEGYRPAAPPPPPAPTASRGSSGGVAFIPITPRRSPQPSSRPSNGGGGAQPASAPPPVQIEYRGKCDTGTSGQSSCPGSVAYVVNHTDRPIRGTAHGGNRVWGTTRSAEYDMRFQVPPGGEYCLGCTTTMSSSSTGMLGSCVDVYYSILNWSYVGN